MFSRPAQVPSETSSGGPSGLGDVVEKSILLAEDDELVGPLVGEMLRSAGYHVVWVRDLADLRRLSASAFTAVVTDLRLLSSDGCEVIEYMRRHVPGIPAVLVSGYGPRVADVCTKRGIMGVRFLSKPFTAGQLFGALTEVIAQCGCEGAPPPASVVARCVSAPHC
jgi:DNA-binding NtrC family response regulator